MEKQPYYYKLWLTISICLMVTDLNPGGLFERQTHKVNGGHGGGTGTRASKIRNYFLPKLSFMFLDAIASLLSTGKFH